MTKLDQILNQHLDKRKAEGNYRTLSQPNHLIDFCSNDYLGLARSPELKLAIEKKLKSTGLQQNGSTGSRLITGNSAYAEHVEHKLATLFKTEAALVFGSGYLANLAVLSSLPQKGDVVLYDEFSHASIKDGLRLNHAHRFPFRHNDMNDLEKKLKKHSGTKWIVTESIFSMHGYSCPLQSLTELASKYDGHILLDEAHSTGILSQSGAGLAVASGLHHKVAVRIHTFGKAMGIHGACIAGSNDLKKYLINFARPFIYTTGPSPHFLASIDAAFEFVAEHPDLQQQLHERIHFFQKLSHIFSALSPIICVSAPGNERARELANRLHQDGFDVRAILSPTVTKGSERFRICVHAFNTNEEIAKIVASLKKENLL